MTSPAIALLTVGAWGADVRRFAETTAAAARQLEAKPSPIRVPSDYLRMLTKIKHRLCVVEHHADRLNHDARNLAAVLQFDREG